MIKHNCISKWVFITFILIFGSGVATAQLAMGKWRTHFSYNSVTQITQSDNKVYAISDGALFSVDKNDGSIEFYSKITGLNGSGVSQIKFDPASKQLLIIYSDGNIDLLSSSGVFNIPDLLNNTTVSKTINNINIYNNKAYLSGNFGIIVINLLKKEIADTYYIGTNASEVKVLSTTVAGSNIYACSATDVYMASVNDPNLVNYQYWTKLSGLPGSGSIQKIGSFNNLPVLLRNGVLYIQNTNNTWTQLAANASYSNFYDSGSQLITSGNNSIYLFDKNLNATTIPTGVNTSDYQLDSASGILWMAANASGVASLDMNNTTQAISTYKPEGPAYNLPWKMVFSNDKMFMVPGGRWSAFYQRPGAVMIMKDQKWTNILSSDIEPKTGTTCQDLVSVAVDPKDDTHFFAASYSSGLYEFKNNVLFKYHNFTNSPIEALFNSYQYQLLDGTTFDKDGNLWMACSFVSKAVKVLMSSGKWATFEFANFKAKPTIQDILISNQNPNQKWLTACRSNPGVFIFDDNGTIENQSDDKSIFLNSFNYSETDANGKVAPKSVTPGAIYSIAQDKNGVIWVGTDTGPFLFQNLTNVFNSNYTCSRVKIPRNDSTNLADYLLVTEKINAIVVDGANRKWLGTAASGLYLMSENGQTTIQHFTTGNSPLLSNNIISLTINPKTGELFIGTDLGLISYQSDASDATDDFTDVHAYPNPVRPNYSGVITITGLIDKTQVKITDINGNLVCQTVSNGSLATWDGKDAHGRKVNSGVYLAMCVNSDGTKSAIAKIMIIN